jgi:type IV pilus assembly protein PilO
MSAANVNSTWQSRAAALNVRERTRGWFNPVNLHWAGVAVLGLVNVYLLINMAFAWQQANSRNAEALQQQRVLMTLAEVAARPLQGLDVKLSAASANADHFYLERLPVSYSQIATELGSLKNRTNVRLTRVQYSQTAVAEGPATDKPGVKQPVTGDPQSQLTEVRMDASLTGDYRALALFLNGVERDKVFFLISGVTLTGQQSGTVSLRIRLTTYLRGLVSDEEMPKAERDSGASILDLEKPTEAPASGIGAVGAKP